MKPASEIMYTDLKNDFLQALYQMLSHPLKDDEAQAHQILELCAIVGGYFLQKELENGVQLELPNTLTHGEDILL